MAPTTPTTPGTRKSSRIAAATPTSAKATPKVEKEAPTKSDEEEKTPKTPSPTKTPRKAATKRGAAATDVQQRPPKRRNVRKSEPGSSKANTSDPFNFDDKEDEHPELFKKVKVERQSFGNMKFLVNGNGDESKYANMEKNAHERRSLVPELLEKTDISKLGLNALRSPKATPKARRASTSSTPKSAKKTPKKTESDSGVNRTLNLEEDEDDYFETPKATPKPAKKRNSGNDSVKATPKIEQKAPELTPEEQVKADDENHAQYPPGARVLAIWGKEYYPAIVADRDGLGRYKVIYIEGQTSRVVPASGVVPIYLIREGTEVFVLGESDEDNERIVYDGKVLKIPNVEDPNEWVKGIYSIELTNEEKVKPEARDIDWSDIYITDQQHKQVMKTKKNPTELLKENIIEAEEGKRTRRSTRSTLSSVDTPTPASVKGRRSAAKQNSRIKTPKFVKDDDSDVEMKEDEKKEDKHDEEKIEKDDNTEEIKETEKDDDDETKESEVDDETVDTKEDVINDSTDVTQDDTVATAVDENKTKEKEDEEEEEKMDVDTPAEPEVEKNGNGVPKEEHVSKNGNKSNGNSSDKVENKAEDKTSIPEEKKISSESDNQIFEGLHFILTSANRNTGLPSFIKKDVKKSIENRGGLVFEGFDGITDDDKVYLIADTYYRTHKYLTALSLSIPTVSFKWIEDSIKENELLDYADYMLDAGESLIDQKKYPWKEIKGKLLPEKRIAVFSQRNITDGRVVNFREIWTPLVKNIGGFVINDIPTDLEKLKEWFGNNDPVEYFITDEGTSKEVIDFVKESGAEPVNSEWLIQCIVTGEVTSPNVERYRPKT